MMQLDYDFYLVSFIGDQGVQERAEYIALGGTCIETLSGGDAITNSHFRVCP